MGVLWSWSVRDCSCPVSKQENKAVPIVDMCVHFRLAGDGSAMAAGLSGCIVGGPGCGFTCGCLSSVEDGVEAAGVVAGVITSSIVCDASSGSAAALRGCLTSLVGAAGAVVAAASDLGRDLTCGCLSSLKGGVEAAGTVAVQYDSFLPYVLIRTALKTSYGDLLLKAFSRAQWTAKRISMGREARV